MRIKVTTLLTLVTAMLLGAFVSAKEEAKELRANYNATVSQVVELKQELSEKPAVKTDYLGEFIVTYYDDCMKCCGKTDGITKSGEKVHDGVTVAVDPSVIPLGEYIYIEGVGYRVTQDIGGAVKGNRIDVYVPSHEQAIKLGIKTAKVWRMEE